MMTGFELRTSGIGSNHSTNWATTISHFHLNFHLRCCHCHCEGCPDCYTTARAAGHRFQTKLWPRKLFAAKTFLLCQEKLIAVCRASCADVKNWHLKGGYRIFLTKNLNPGINREIWSDISVTIFLMGHSRSLMSPFQRFTVTRVLCKDLLMTWFEPSTSDIGIDRSAKEWASLGSWQKSSA